MPGRSCWRGRTARGRQGVTGRIPRRCSPGAAAPRRGRGRGHRQLAAGTRMPGPGQPVHGVLRREDPAARPGVPGTAWRPPAGHKRSPGTGWHRDLQAGPAPRGRLTLRPRARAHGTVALDADALRDVHGIARFLCGQATALAADARAHIVAEALAGRALRALAAVASAASAAAAAVARVVVV